MKNSLTDFSHLSPVRMVAAIAVAILCCISYAQEPIRWQRGQNKTAGTTPNQGKRKADLSLYPKNYTRPKPIKPIVPSLPQMSRLQPDKFFLEKADVLYSNEEWDTLRQVVSGNVLFSKFGTKLYCDSAWYYPETSSLDAFGNVRMVQGDTLEVKSDYIFYDGNSQTARLRTAGRGKEVSLEHWSKHDNTKKYLYTDSLDYNLLQKLAYFTEGGRMYNHNLRTNERDTLTAHYGQYNTGTRVAEVTGDVQITNRTSRLNTDRLLYHTDTRVVDVVDRTEIFSGPEYIRTSAGNYEMATGNAQLTSRSFISHLDSTGAETTLEGDLLSYDAALRRSEAFMSPNGGTPMVITDTARKAILIGGYGYYSDLDRTAYAERYPLLKEYSRKDTTFLRADKVFLQTFNSGVKPLPRLFLDSLSTPADSIEAARIDSINANSEYHVAKAYNRARFFRDDIQGIADSITMISRDSLLFLDRKPIVWSGPRMVAGSKIIVHFNDSTADKATLPAKGLVAEVVGEGFYNQLRAGHITAFLENETLKHLDAHTDVQAIILPQEEDSTYNKLMNATGDTLSVDLDSTRIEKIKLYARSGSEVSGQVIPLYILQKSQFYLPEFISLTGASKFSEMEGALKTLEALRPKYAWYRKGWEDGLGELSFELEEYFSSPTMGILPPEEDLLALPLAF
ncbi:MAG: hypothetical protein NC402_00180 [Prevotella sp.]|nr:hypothetical protein [Prevotella sp.]MCM1074427.1 hypothetical protein [Ruminococcus sp.]